MEITGLSAAYLQDYQAASRPGALSVTSALAANAATGAGTKRPDFASILERAKNADKPVSVTNSAGKTDKIDKDDRLYQLCLELETFLVKNLLTSMRSTVQKSGLIEQGFAGKMYEDMLYDEYAKVLTENAHFGLAEQAYLQLKYQ